MYRLEENSSIDRLDLPSSFQEAVTLIEWADKLQQLPEHRLIVTIRLVSEQTKVCNAFGSIIDAGHSIC